MRVKSTKPKTTKASATKVVEDIRRTKRKLYPTEENIHIVLEGLSGENSITELRQKQQSPAIWRSRSFVNGSRGGT